MTVHMTITDIEEYSVRSNTVLNCTMYNQITVGNVTLPKAVLSTVKIFAECRELIKIFTDQVHDIALLRVRPLFEKSLLKADRPLEIPPHGKIVIALHSFMTNNRDDLILVQGEEYEVLDDSQQGRST